MHIEDLKRQVIREATGVDDSFGRVHSYIEYGNVTYWFDNDTQDADRNPLSENQRLIIDLQKLRDFCYAIGEDARFYYGHSASDTSFIVKVKYVFGKHRVPTKQIRYVRHYLTDQELTINTRVLFQDLEKNKQYIKIPKCNFDVEIAVDAMRNIEKYDTFCLFSSDADFVHLARFLKSKDKKFILVKGGPIDKTLREVADLIINAQDIKKYISSVVG